jgi:hypothetical protein
MRLRAVYPGFGEYDHEQERGAFRQAASYGFGLLKFEAAWQGVTLG